MSAPKSFMLDGERYYVGADVGQYLKFHRGTLYKKYPSLWKRFATQEEKRRIQETGCATSCITSSIMLVKANEIDEILQGNDNKFRLAGSATSSQKTESASSTPVGKIRPRMMSSVEPPTASVSVHREPVPSAVPIAYGRGHASISAGYNDAMHYSALIANASERVDLVPIRLDMEVDGVKLRECFCYNRHEQLVTPDVVAEALCDDLDLPEAFAAAITQAIQSQVDVFSELPPIDESATDQRTVLNLHVTVGNQTLMDRIEWDMTEPDNDPELFASQLCSDLGLGGEFQSAIAYSIRGQLAWNRQSYAFSDTPLPTVDCPFRNPADANMCGPLLEKLSESEMERKMRDQDRNTRRIRRLAAVNPYGLL